MILCLVSTNVGTSQIKPFEEYQVTICRVCHDKDFTNIGIGYTLDIELSEAIIQGLVASDNTMDDPEGIRGHQHFIHSDTPISKSLIDDLQKIVKSLDLSATITHGDLYSRTRTLPFLNRDTTLRFVLRDHVLVLATEAANNQYRAEIITRRQMARDTIQIPAGTAPTVRPAPGNQLEAAARLAQLTSQITDLNTQLQQLQGQFRVEPPAPPNPPNPPL